MSRPSPAAFIAETVDLEEIRVHCCRTHPMINPGGLVAVRPAEVLPPAPGSDAPPAPGSDAPPAPGG